jgi:hypothetical protein
MHHNEFHAGWRSHMPALLVFCALAVILVGRSLFSGGQQVCAANAPDTWIHMWAYWRAKYAVLGHDHSYLFSHTLTYPGVVREPIAVFDPLLPLLSIPLQLAFDNCAIAYNWLVCFGLIFSGMAGYALGLAFTGKRSAALIAGVIIVANPFTYRLLAGGYAEYAWWGVLPLTVALYHKTLQRPSRWGVARYIASLAFMLLMSIYCALYFVMFATASLLLNLLHAARRSTSIRLKRLLKTQLLALLCLTPLLLFWIHSLSMLGWKNVEWPRPFPIESIREYAQRDLYSFEDTAPLPPLIDETEAAELSPESDVRDWLAWRTLSGSLDLAELTSVKQSWAKKYPPPSESPSDANAEASEYLDESAFAREWLIVIALALLGIATLQTRRTSVQYAALGLAFALLALGPLAISNGHIASFITLPYAWLYHWVPGFSRFVIPGRAFLGTIVCLAILTARGTESIVATVTKRLGSQSEAGVSILVASVIIL